METLISVSLLVGNSTAKEIAKAFCVSVSRTRDDGLAAGNIK